MKTTCLTLTMAFAFALTFARARAQNSWTNRYSGPGNGYNYAMAIAVDGSGNVFVTGDSTGNASGQDYTTIKYSNAGAPLWTNRYSEPGTNTDTATAIVVDGVGNVFVTGRSTGSGDALDYATIKYSNDGVPLWTNRYSGSSGNDAAAAIALDTNGNVFVTGRSTNNSSSYDYATIAYSGAGVPLWTNRYNGTGNGNDIAYAIAVDGHGNIFITGLSLGIGSLSDYATIKYSNGGVPLWTNRYHGPGSGNDGAIAIAMDGNGNVFVTGSSSSNSSGNDYVTIKYSNDGAPLWTNRYNGPGNSRDDANAITVDGNGNVFVTGSSYGDTGTSYDYATIKYSNDGVPLWTNRYDGPANSIDQVRAIAVDGSGNVFVAGSSFGSGSLQDYATIAYSNAGVPLWTNRYDGPGNSEDVVGAIAVDGNGNAFVTGYSNNSSESNSYDYATIKYESVSLPPTTVLENPQVIAGEFSFDLVAEPGGQFAIQVSTNLVNWNAIREVIIPAEGTTNIVETLLPAADQTYYRAQRR